jgi:hypothetical protein
MGLQHRQLELDQQLGWIGADDGVGINAMKCASVSFVYSLSLSVHCAVAGKVPRAAAAAASSNSNRVVYYKVQGERRAGLAGSSGLSAARQRVPWPLP